MNIQSQSNFLVNSTPLPAVIHDNSGSIFASNDLFRELFQDSKTLQELVPSAKEPNLQEWLNSIDSASASTFKSIFCSKSGERNLDLHTRLLEDFEEKYFLTIFQDVTEFVKTQVETAHQEQKMEIALEAMNAGIWEWDIKNGGVTLDERMTEIIGYSNEDLQPLDVETWYEYVHPDDSAATHQVLLDHLQGKRSSFDHVFRMHHKEGHYGWVHGRAKVNKWDADGNPTNLIGTHVKFDEWKNFEAKLLEEKNLLRSLIDAIPDSIYFKDERLRYILVNQAKARQHHLKPDDLIGKTDFDVFPEEIAQFSKKDDDYILSTGKVISGKEEKLRMYDGTTKWVLITKLPRLNHEGEIIGVMGISRNITQRKAEEERRKLQLDHYRDILSTVPEGVIIFDEKQKVVYANNLVHEMFGYESQELIGKDGKVLMTEESQQRAKAALEKRNPGETSKYQIEVYKKDGNLMQISGESKSLYSVDGTFEGSCAIIAPADREQTGDKHLLDQITELDIDKSHKTICASCKKIEFGGGNWDSIEKYIHQKYHELFSHGICPDCLAKLSMEFTTLPDTAKDSESH
jgi:PAS domain S-box-containing protein